MWQDHFQQFWGNAIRPTACFTFHFLCYFKNEIWCNPSESEGAVIFFAKISRKWVSIWIYEVCQLRTYAWKKIIKSISYIFGTTNCILSTTKKSLEYLTFIFAYQSLPWWVPRIFSCYLNIPWILNHNKKINIIIFNE